MDTKALEKFCPWARLELIDAVDMRCKQFALDDDGRKAFPLGSDTISGIAGGKALTAAEKSQRDALYTDIEREGYAAFCEQQAYRWFNRFAAIRYMELHGFLPNGVRMLSAPDGSFTPECLRAVDSLNLPGLDAQVAFDLAMAGDDENLFRHIIVAQMNELADCLPTIFGPVSSADELTLPGNLLMRNEHNTLQHLVEDIPEDAWGNVEILGWMYQFYNSELKDAFFKSKRKASVADLAPATQLFTPDWIVRYMVENSLGRLWMLNNPNSNLREHMAYYIEPDAQHEDFIRIEGPEDITFCDPACGSGHILVCAFDLLMQMYLERGYREREIPELILTKNLAGLEIDDRAAQYASLQLAMVAREHDRRFFGRGVVADIHALQSVDLDEDNLPSALVGKKDLVETITHLSEIGSLFTPGVDDLAALDTALAELSGGDILSSFAREQIELAKQQCEALARTFDVVVANPPYMSSGSFNPFMNKWMKKNYPDSCKDLCTAFIERGISMSRGTRLVSMVTASSWMFISSFETFRKNLLSRCRITSMIQQSTHGFPYVTVPTTMFVLQIESQNSTGCYIRLEGFDRPQWQQPRALEAIENPDCGWFYRADASTFHDIPGSPIAYWTSDAMHKAFVSGTPLGKTSQPKQGMVTRNNDRFMRSWWEVQRCQTEHHLLSHEDAKANTSYKWVPCTSGGAYRKWYGNNHCIMNWALDGKELIEFSGPHIKNREFYFRPAITWSAISSSRLSLRFIPAGFVPEHAGNCLYGNEVDLKLLQALCNSTLCLEVMSILSPTLNFNVGDIVKIPLLNLRESSKEISALVDSCRLSSQADWDDQETSWDFKRNPLI